MDKSFIIAEAGVNHCGSVERALDMVDVAAGCGADAIKFQTFDTDLLVSTSAPTADYQRTAVGESRQDRMLRALELPKEAHGLIVERCARRSIEFMSTPFDLGSAAFLVSLGMKRLKVPSGELTNDVFLQGLSALGLPLIVSTGMATLAEVRHAVSVLSPGAAACRDGIPALVLLHCTSNYPAHPLDVNLRAMATMASELGLPVGYSDHTLGINASVAAIALGAVVIEKHFTLDRTLPGPDHAASLEPGGLAELVRSVREVEAMLGSPEKQPSPSEFAVRAVARRSVASARALVRGQCIAVDDLTCLRPGSGIPPSELTSLVGKVVLRDVSPGTLLERDWLG